MQILHKTSSWKLRVWRRQRAYICIGGEKCVGVGFMENNLKNLAGCDRWKSHRAIAEHRRVRCDNFAPCDIDEAHLAMFAHHTLQHSPIAPCDYKIDHLPLTDD